MLSTSNSCQDYDAGVRQLQHTYRVGTRHVEPQPTGEDKPHGADPEGTDHAICVCFWAAKESIDISNAAGDNICGHTAEEQSSSKLKNCGNLHITVNRQRLGGGECRCHGEQAIY